MDHPCYQLFASAGLATEQDGRIRVGHLEGAPNGMQKRLAFPH